MKRLITASLTGVFAVAWAAAGVTAPEGVLAKRTSLARLDLSPQAAVWKGALPVRVDIMPQNMTNPSVQAPAVKRMTVRAVHNGTEIAFLLEWQDSTKDETPRSGVFPDAVALELPMDPQNPAAPMMGNPQGRVHIIQWRADWQKEVDKGPTKITDLFPNMVNDAPAEQVYKDNDQILFSGGRVAGNIVSQSHLRSVVDLMAEGFGSLTPKPTQSAVGKGVWKNGTWQVVINRPLMAQADRDAAPLSVGGRSSIAFAVWNGSQGERGSRKGWAPWMPLTIEK